MFGKLSDAMYTVAANPYLDGIAGKQPRGPLSQNEQGVVSLGPVLTGAQLTFAQGQESWQRALAYWLGHERFARKYGASDPPSPMSDVDQSEWDRYVATANLWIARLSTLLPSMAMQRPQRVQAKPDEAKPNEAKPNEVKSDEAKPDEAKPDENVDPVDAAMAQALSGMLQGIPPERRAKVVSLVGK